MIDFAIRVENLGKRYRIGQIAGYKTLRDTLTNAVTAPFRRQKPTDRRTPGANPPVTGDEQAGYIWALKDVSFEVKQGEAVGIIGRNGSGKSTLLKILSRITAPTEGQVEIYGRAGTLLEVGTGFHPELTGRENIYLNGAILGLKKAEIERKFDDIIAFAEIEKFLDTPVKRYSSGMYVRLAFSVAAHLEPDVLLVDEVLAVGDLAFQKKCLGKMESVTQEGRTVLFVSHNMGSIVNFCPRALWFDEGQLVDAGNTREVISAYIGSNQEAGGEVSWPDIKTSPGSDNVRLRAVRIKSDGVVTSNVPIDKEVVIEMDYFNLQEGAVLYASIHLRDKVNSFVLASASWPSANLSVDKWFEKKRPKGMYRTTCVIPANFLNNDYYAIDAGISNQRREWEVREESIISFLVHETGEMKKEYSGDWVGVVRPKLDWSTDYLGEGWDKES